MMIRVLGHSDVLMRTMLMTSDPNLLEIHYEWNDFYVLRLRCLLVLYNRQSHVNLAVGEGLSFYVLEFRQFRRC